MGMFSSCLALPNCRHLDQDGTYHLLFQVLYCFCISTRVVQKLIETLKTRQQISLVISALEPGFLALIKDLNGNHVVQRCLQCFTTEDSKVISLLKIS